MKQNNEFVQQTLTQKHFDRIEKLSIEKKSLLNMFNPNANKVLDLESETGCFKEKEITCLTQISHLKKYLKSSFYGTIQSIDNEKFDSIISHNHLEYEKYPIGIAPYVLNKLKPGGSWIICLPIDNNIECNYEGRVHEFTNESSILFASEICYNFTSYNMEESIIIVIK